MTREQYMAVMRALHEQGYIYWEAPDKRLEVELLTSNPDVEIDEQKILERRAFELKGGLDAQLCSCHMSKAIFDRIFWSRSTVGTLWNM